eukprot:3005367-Rhodomonas_salina.1
MSDTHILYAAARMAARHRSASIWSDCRVIDGGESDIHGHIRAIYGIDTAIKWRMGGKVPLTLISVPCIQARPIRFVGGVPCVNAGHGDDTMLKGESDSHRDNGVDYRGDVIRGSCTEVGYERYCIDLGMRGMRGTAVTLVWSVLAGLAEAGRLVGPAR